MGVSIVARQILTVALYSAFLKMSVSPGNYQPSAKNPQPRSDGAEGVGEALLFNVLAGIRGSDRHVTFRHAATLRDRNQNLDVDARTIRRDSAHSPYLHSISHSAISHFDLPWLIMPKNPDRRGRPRSAINQRLPTWYMCEFHSPAPWVGGRPSISPPALFTFVRIFASTVM